MKPYIRLELDGYQELLEKYEIARDRLSSLDAAISDLSNALGHLEVKANQSPAGTDD